MSARPLPRRWLAGPLALGTLLALVRRALPHREALEAYGAMLEGRPLGRAGGLR
jgi:hypothetical protein